MSLGDKFNKLKDDHGDQINKGIDDAQTQHSDKFGQHKDTADKLIDQGQEKYLGNDPKNPDKNA